MSMVFDSCAVARMKCSTVASLHAWHDPQSFCGVNDTKSQKACAVQQLSHTPGEDIHYELVNNERGQSCEDP